MFILIRVLLLSLAAEDARADAKLGGGGTDVLGGSEGSEQLVGFGGRTRYVLTRLAATNSPAVGVKTSSTAGHDALLRGLGEDFIEAKDGEREYVECGSGKDVANADLIDRVTPSCDILYPG